VGQIGQQANTNAPINKKPQTDSLPGADIARDNASERKSVTKSRSPFRFFLSGKKEASFKVDEPDKESSASGSRRWRFFRSGASRDGETSGKQSVAS